MRGAAVAAKRNVRRSPFRKAVKGGFEAQAELGCLAAAKLEPINAFYRRRAPLEMAIAGRTTTIAAEWAATQPDFVQHAVLGFAIGRARGCLELPLSIVDGWLSRADPEGLHDRLTPAQAALLIEALLSEELSFLEERFNSSIELGSLDRRPDERIDRTFTFSIETDLGGERCALVLDDEWIVRLGRLLDEMQEALPPMDMNIPANASFARAVTSLSIRQLQSLAPGDVILPDDAEQEEGVVLAMFGGHFIARMQFLGKERGKLLGALAPIRGSKWEWIMNAKQTDATKLEDSDFEDLPISIVFEVARTSLPLKEMRQLAPGAVMSVPDLTEPTVDILANGKRVGRGEIVRIGEGLGVRVMRIFDNA